MHRLLGNPERISHLSIGPQRRIRNLGRCHTPWGSWRHGPLVPARRRSAAARVVDAAAAGRLGGPARADPVADPPRRLHADGPGRSRLAPGGVDLQAPRLPPRAQPRRHRAGLQVHPHAQRRRPTAASRRATSAGDLPGRPARPSSSPSGTTSRPSRRVPPWPGTDEPRRARRRSRGSAPSPSATPPHASPPPAPRRAPWPPHPHPGRPRGRLARRAGGRSGR